MTDIELNGCRRFATALESNETNTRYELFKQTDSTHDATLRQHATSLHISTRLLLRFVDEQIFSYLIKKFHLQELGFDRSTLMTATVV